MFRHANSHKGVTLIELMIVVAIVGILAAIAYPSYQEQVRKSRRADAQGALMQLAQFMERVYTENDCYNPGDAHACESGWPTLPFRKSPIDSAQRYYTLALRRPDCRNAQHDRSAFCLRATPVAGGPQDGDGYLELMSTGERRWDKDNSKNIQASERNWDPR